MTFSRTCSGGVFSRSKRSICCTSELSMSAGRSCRCQQEGVATVDLHEGSPVQQLRPDRFGPCPNPAT
eukprot:CAMPEP_0119376928 /NCGR_PEP_ID=MMETSP1334-20130426/42156_1 /TAXON_ID=127549 /ORGANISM="Calcidiscus leptoporus, Strain RCC1130" /LENGTH=67 /DNA_ID=CAMNT_0007395661 /DNA_START=67 /DNA_END=266 /DNA_ORIENTATION=+